MKVTRIFALLILTSIFAGCASTNQSSQSIQIINGYPCTNNCDGFKRGFELAEAKNLTAKSDCGTIESRFKLGCESYIHEYKVAHDDSGGYLF